MGVSLKPSETTKGGGLLDDEDVKIVESKFVMFDYGGKAQPVPALLWKLDAMDGSEPVAQYWSMGKATDWIPSDDGKELVPIGRATQLVESSNGMVLIGSAVNAGFPESKLGDDVTIFEGMECHVNRIAAPERKGMVSKKENQTILTVSKIHKLPWEKDADKEKSKSTSTKSKSRKSSKSKPGGPENSSDERSVEDIATEFLLNLLADEARMAQYPDGIPKARLAPEAFGAFPASDPNRSAVVQTVFKDEFLNSGPWTYSGGKLSMA